MKYENKGQQVSQIRLRSKYVDPKAGRRSTDQTVDIKVKDSRVIGSAAIGSDDPNGNARILGLKTRRFEAYKMLLFSLFSVSSSLFFVSFSH